MQRLGAVHEEARCPGGRERRRHLPADVPRLAEPRDDHVTLRVVEHPDRLREPRIQAIADGRDRCRLQAEAVACLARHRIDDRGQTMRARGRGALELDLRCGGVRSHFPVLFLACWASCPNGLGRRPVRAYARR